MRTKLKGAIYGGGPASAILGKYLGTKAVACPFKAFSFCRSSSTSMNKHSAYVPNTPMPPPTAPANVVKLLLRWLVVILMNDETCQQKPCESYIVLT